MSPPFPGQTLTSSPLWTSAFRPFYFLGALYAPLFLAAWLGAFLGLWNPPSGELPLKLQHGHEFIFGFAAAIITGIVLTALPSWAGTEEIRGGRLILLVVTWLSGRVAFWASPGLPAPLPALADGLLYASLLVMLTPQLLRATNRLYLLLLPILLAMFAADLLYHHAASSGNQILAAQALRLAIYAIIMLYVLKGGVLAPIFTGNALREKGRGALAPCNMNLEIAAVGALLQLAALDLPAAPRAGTGAAAAISRFM
ncbi:MAG: NnrS family protein, partial [Betaproteobacteria bacterium]|nr:NnrS family protein [Betaproteobacteria bacterium]